MKNTGKNWPLHLPPYRVEPESTRRLMHTTLAALSLPALVAVLFFGYQALKLMLIALATAGAAEIVCNKIRHEKVPGSISHSLTMGLILAFTLPGDTPGYIAVIGSAAAVLIGKQLFGGLGHYLWHPALVGRLIVQMFFHDQLSGRFGPVLARQNIFFGDINAHAAEPLKWFDINWFRTLAPAGTESFLLPHPLAALHEFADLEFVDSVAQMGQYFLNHLPSLAHCIVGAIPGHLGETCSIVLILVALFYFYRGYIHWQLPVVFLASAYVSAMLLPIVVDHPDKGDAAVLFPIAAQNLAVGFTYVNYQFFSGSLLLGACIIAADMTARPVTITGQILFAAGAGLFTMAFRLYTPIAIPCYTAILLMNTLVPSIDRVTRPRLRANP